MAADNLSRVVPPWGMLPGAAPNGKLATLECGPGEQQEMVGLGGPANGPCPLRQAQQTVGETFLRSARFRHVTGPQTAS